MKPICGLAIAVMHIWALCVAFVSVKGVFVTALSVFLTFDFPLLSWIFWIWKRYSTVGCDAFCIGSFVTIGLVIVCVLVAMLENK